ncbi:MAG TPA: APC family permease [Bryobacteraceae bacterium]|nr:APC family permease [Bryobacteraceae bacterium]
MPGDATLKRELGLRDLTLFAIACIIGTRWIASAAHAGPGSILLWVLAAIFLLIPLAIATAALTVKHPEAGGLYRWTRADFGPWHAFLAFWVYWTGIAFWFPSAAMFYTSIALSGTAHADDRIWLVALSLAAIWTGLGTNVVGLNVGKWTENLGASASWMLGILFAIVAIVAWRRHGSATAFHLIPVWSWDTVSFWATIAYAMTGIEMVGLMGSEIRDPARNLPRAAWISSLFTTLFYVGTTAALLVLLRPDQISELNGIAQAGTAAGLVIGVAWLPRLFVLLVLATAVGQFGGLGSSVSRMPFAAGVDHLLPAAFAKIHPRWNTPHVSIVSFGLIASALLIALQFGDTVRAAYQTLVSLMVIGGFLPYLYMFASAWKAGRRWSASAGIAMTLLAIVCSVVPTAEIHNVWLFEGKLAVGTIAMVASAWLMYHWQSRRPST